MVQSLAGRFTGIEGTDLAANANVLRSQMASETAAFDPIPLTNCRVWDDMAVNLAATGGSPSVDDLGLVTGTWATDVAHLKTSDMDTTSVTQRCCFLYTFPMNYVDNASASISVGQAGMLTNVADTCFTVDLEAYLMDFGLISGSDLVNTSATTINSLTDANKDFALITSTLVAGSQIMVRLTVAGVDGGTGAAVFAKIGQLGTLLTVKG